MHADIIICQLFYGRDGFTEAQLDPSITQMMNEFSIDAYSIPMTPAPTTRLRGKDSICSK